MHIPDLIRANTLANMEALRNTPSFSPIGNKPCLIVGAGPSLRNDLNTLRRQTRFKIFCVARAARVVMNAGIKPDFIVQAEPRDYTRFVDGLNLAQVDLVLADGVHPAWWSIPCRRKYCYLNMANATSMEALGSEKLVTPSGGSVSHDAFCLAHFAGSDLIAMLGMDHALSGGQSYAGNEDQHTRQDLPTVQIEGIKQPLVETTHDLASFILWWAREASAFRRPNSHWINCSSDGAQIPGFEHRNLKTIAFNR